MKKLLLALFLTVILIFSACADKEPPEATAPDVVEEEPQYTKGLVYAANGLGGCAVTGYVGTDTDIIIPDEHDGMQVTSVANSAFAGNSKITSVTLGANVKVIDAVAFVGCEKLAEVNLCGTLEKIESAAFFGCSNLKTVSLPATLKEVGIDTFAGCPLIETVNYDGNQSMWSRVSVAPNNTAFDTKLVLAEGGAMVKLIDKGECNANISWRLGYDEILYITGNGHIPNYNFDNVPWGAYCESISKVVVEDGIDVIGKNAFLGCYNLVSVELAPTVRLIEDGAFYGCKAISEIILPENLRRIGESVFFGCEELVSIDIPDSVTAIGAGAFMGCVSLEEVKMSSAVTKIEKWCFANCAALKTIDLSNVESIGTNAFFGGNTLAVVKISDKLMEIGTNAFLSCPQVFLNGTLSPDAVIGEGNARIKK